MSKHGDILEAERQCAEEEWKCATCDAPAEENGKYCMPCRVYWEDVSAGLFDREEDGE